MVSDGGPSRVSDRDPPGVSDRDPAGAAAGTQAAPPEASEAASRAHHGELRPQLIALLPDLRAFARFLARDRTLADDLVQDTLVRALGALDQFQRGTNLKAWLFTIQRNAFYEQSRRRRREHIAMQEQFAGDEAEGAPQHGAAELSDLQRMLFSLPPLLREALVLVGAQELSHEQAAAICGVPVGTMKARVSRARAKLAQITGRRPLPTDGTAE